MNADSLDIRWKQRFQNFDRAFVLLRSALEEKPIAQFNRLEQEGLIQRFEYTYELAWKTAKDYLKEVLRALEEKYLAALENLHLWFMERAVEK
jgi:hypothetical protein